MGKTLSPAPGGKYAEAGCTVGIGRIAHLAEEEPGIRPLQQVGQCIGPVEHQQQ